MSAFQLKLSALTESACGHLSHLETSGSTLNERFLSLVSRAPSGRARRLSGLGSELTADEGLEVPGESSVLSRLTVGVGFNYLLSVFELTPDLANGLRLGSVGNGLKFCTLGASNYSFTTHSKKVTV